MGKKNKTISFRVKEDKFNALREIADKRDISLSSVFRDYVDQLVGHEGRVKVVPKHEVMENSADDDHPVKVEVPKSFVREHERIELENEHLREQLAEYKQYATQLKGRLEEREEETADMVRLEELDEEIGTTLVLD